MQQEWRAARDAGAALRGACRAARWAAVAARLLVALLAVGLLLEDGSTALSLQRAQGTDDIVVVLPAGVSTASVLRDLDIRPTYRYEHVFEGFAAEVPREVRQALEQIPGVIVSPNRRVEAAKNSKNNKNNKKVSAEKKCKKKKGKARKRCKKRQTQNPPQVSPGPITTPGGAAQVIPTGVLRIAADENPQAGIRGDGGAIDVDVAVLDSGIASHPDLTIAGGQACTGEGTADGDGHGTHVAGSIGALDNSFGVVGVAPGARLYAVKVLNNQGDGTSASVICGLDWVAEHANTIDVVNMSLGGTAPETTCLNDAVHAAVCEVVLAGIPVIVAAGNESEDAANHFPANYEEAITVSAFSDFDGEPGGQAAATCNDDDDSFAYYSNFGAEVDISAPGTCILSTVPGNTYGRMTGTSMATPHVSGAAALYIARNPAATPVDVRAYLTTVGSRPQRSPEGFAVQDDPDGIPEPVLYIPIGA